MDRLSTRCGLSRGWVVKTGQRPTCIPGRHKATPWSEFACDSSGQRGNSTPTHRSHACIASPQCGFSCVHSGACRFGSASCTGCTHRVSLCGRCIMSTSWKLSCSVCIQRASVWSGSSGAAAGWWNTEGLPALLALYGMLLLMPQEVRAVLEGHFTRCTHRFYPCCGYFQAWLEEHLGRRIFFVFLSSTGVLSSMNPLVLPKWLHVAKWLPLFIVFIVFLQAGVVPANRWLATQEPWLLPLCHPLRARWDTEQAEPSRPGSCTRLGSRICTGSSTHPPATPTPDKAPWPHLPRWQNPWQGLQDSGSQ